MLNPKINYNLIYDLEAKCDYQLAETDKTKHNDGKKDQAVSRRFELSKQIKIIQYISNLRS